MEHPIASFSLLGSSAPSHKEFQINVQIGTPYPRATDVGLLGRAPGVSTIESRTSWVTTRFRHSVSPPSLLGSSWPSSFDVVGGFGVLVAIPRTLFRWSRTSEIRDCRPLGVQPNKRS